MVTTILRCFIIYFVALFVLRIMGKRQIGEMQPFELVITLIIADLATVPMADSKIPLLNGVVPLLTLCVIHFLITVVALKWNKFNKFVNGNPIIVIDSNGINEKNLKKLFLTVEDLVEMCRNAGYFNLNDIQYAIIETNGMISVLPKSNMLPLVRQDMNVSGGASELGVVVISEGKVVIENLSSLHLSENEVLSFIAKQGYKSEKEIAALIIYGKQCYLKKYGKRARYFEKISFN